MLHNPEFSATGRQSLIEQLRLRKETELNYMPLTVGEMKWIRWRMLFQKGVRVPAVHKMKDGSVICFPSLPVEVPV